MVDNLGRKIAIIALFLAVSVLSLSVAGFRLGLDLQGGTRLVYHIDFQKAVDENQIDAAALNDKSALLQEIISIIKQRVDPQGVREPVIRAEGTDRIVIELPGSGTEVRQSVSGALAAALPVGGEGADQIVLVGTDADLLERFPLAGGIVEIDSEQISYSKREGAILKGLQRPYSGTTKAAHTATTAVTLKNIDPWRALIENVGNMTFHIAAQDSDFEGETDLTAELERAKTWVSSNPELDITSYNRLSRAEGGPWRSATTDRAMVFFPMPNTDGVTPLAERIRGLIIEENPDWRFAGSDLLSTGPSTDQLGYPAVAFAMKDDRKTDFENFTDNHVEELMAIVINDEIATMPNIESALPGGGIITGGIGGFTSQEVTDLVTVLRSGSLRIKPELEHQERVGATLGDDYVKKGEFSAILGLSFVLIFILIYYRRLGRYAAISLVCNITMLMGALSFLQATLTLPGVAGIILTVGMAVDANILIFERIREEALRGRKPLQAAKNGFQHALSTIVDANMTTLITAFILYKFGTGPIRGFATTLSIGILTSMFSALIITKVLVHRALEKGVESWSMRRLITESKIDFMSKAKVAMSISVALILAGLFLFTGIENEKKLGIDFLGGASLTVRTQEPQPVDGIRELISSNVRGVIGKSSEVKAILNSEAEPDTYNQFRITFKTPQAVVEEAMAAQGSGGVERSQEQVQDDIKATVETVIREALASVLEKGPFENVSVTGTAASGTLYFEIPHDPLSIGDVLNTVGVTNPLVTQVTGPVAAYSFTGTTNAGMTAAALESLIQAKFQETIDPVNGEVYTWANPIPETSIVGAAVVAELRDAAIFAILLSLFAVVMYIRVRFAEYSYGFAAVCALVHDVLFTVGVLGIAIMTDFIEAEINLPMIAAFLTIIGYSLNDTIVVFDRIRENMPRMSGSLKDIINTSINQTLSRTILTSITTLLTVLILFAFNLGSRNVLEGFSFAMAIGVLVGTYSSMFIATPVLLWLESRRDKSGDAPSSAKSSEPEAALQA